MSNPSPKKILANFNGRYSFEKVSKSRRILIDNSNRADKYYPKLFLNYNRKRWEIVSEKNGEDNYLDSHYRLSSALGLAINNMEQNSVFHSYWILPAAGIRCVRYLISSHIKYNTCYGILFIPVVSSLDGAINWERQKGAMSIFDAMEITDTDVIAQIDLLNL